MTLSWHRALIPATRAVAMVALAWLSVACGGSVTVPESPVESDVRDAGSDAPPSSQLPEDATPLPPDAVDTLYHSSTSGFVDAARVVAGTSEEWDDVWVRLTEPMTPVPERPEVDFDEARVAVIALGRRSTGGYQIEIRDVSRTADGIFVTVREVRPGAACVVAQVVTSPAMALRLPGTVEDVVFLEEAEDRGCG